jgi:hypothetical protein
VSEITLRLHAPKRVIFLQNKFEVAREKTIADWYQNSRDHTALAAVAAIVAATALGANKYDQQRTLANEEWCAVAGPHRLRCLRSQRIPDVDPRDDCLTRLACTSPYFRVSLIRSIGPLRARRSLRRCWRRVAKAGGPYQWCPGDEIGAIAAVSIPLQTEGQIGTGASAAATTTSITGRAMFHPLSGRATIPRARIPGMPPICAGPSLSRGRADYELTARSIRRPANQAEWLQPLCNPVPYLLA